MSISLGIYSPPKADLDLSGGVFNFSAIVPCHVYELTRQAGSAIGSAVVGYPREYAQDAAPELGKTALIKVDNKPMFRGVVGEAPFEIGPTRDEIRLVLFDDKWLLNRRVLGQVGIGTQGSPAGATGFKDVGFECLFNPEGRPNKDPSSLDFNTGSTAVLWTLSDIMQWLFTYYIGTDEATLDAGAQLTGDGYARAPSHLLLSGQSPLQAIDTVAQLAGESWALTPGPTASAFQCVRPGAGTVRTFKLFPPQGGQQITSAGKYHAISCDVPRSIRNVRDVYQAVSAPVLKEHTYTSTGTAPLLKLQASFAASKEYQARYEVDVTQYAAHNLGANLSAGSRPKLWSPDLVTRVSADGSAYLTAAQIASTPVLAANERVQKPVLWISPTSTDPDDARLCTGGYRLDLRAGRLDLKNTVELMPDSGETPEQVAVSSWASAGVWLTVATVLETVVSDETEVGAQYLPTQFYQVISKPDLVPEVREYSYLPDLSGDNNARTQVAGTPAETYIDVADRLSEAIASAIAETASIESAVTLTLPFCPLVAVGDRIAIVGREIGLSGDEVITELVYQFEDSYANEVVVRGTNVVGAIDPDAFVRES